MYFVWGFKATFKLFLWRIWKGVLGGRKSSMVEGKLTERPIRPVPVPDSEDVHTGGVRHFWPKVVKHSTAVLKSVPDVRLVFNPEALPTPLAYTARGRSALLRVKPQRTGAVGHFSKP